MTPPPRLTEDALAAALTDPALRAWSVRDGKLYRDYRFPGFIEAIGFMTSAAMRAFAMDHHPEWTNISDRLAVSLVTHDSGGITDRDLQLARHFERLAAGRVLS
jgi:4a-hydroxytetrahydrobiopterin dehydratase